MDEVYHDSTMTHFVLCRWKEGKMQKSRVLMKDERARDACDWSVNRG